MHPLPPRFRTPPAAQGGVGVFEVVLFRSLTLVAFTVPELLWERINPFNDRRCVCCDSGLVVSCSRREWDWVVFPTCFQPRPHFRLLPACCTACPTQARLMPAVTAPALWASFCPLLLSRRWLYVARGALGFCSVSSLYLAVLLLPMADAAVLAFLSPIYVALLRWRCSNGGRGLRGVSCGWGG